MTIKIYCHINSFALSLALKHRHGATRKWPIKGVVRVRVSDEVILSKSYPEKSFSLNFEHPFDSRECLKFRLGNLLSKRCISRGTRLREL